MGRRGSRRQDIDIHLLKPARFRQNSEWALPPDAFDSVVHDEVLDPEPGWMPYKLHTEHQVLGWLPTKLAEWIGANLSDELQIPDKNKDKWTAAELNSILINNVVSGSHGHLHRFMENQPDHFFYDRLCYHVQSPASFFFGLYRSICVAAHATGTRAKGPLKHSIHIGS